ncbi:unnamed protein product [Lampetra fluviatilis]
MEEDRVGNLEVGNEAAMGGTGACRIEDLRPGCRDWQRSDTQKLAITGKRRPKADARGGGGGGGGGGDREQQNDTNSPRLSLLKKPSLSLRGQPLPNRLPLPTVGAQEQNGSARRAASTLALCGSPTNPENLAMKWHVGVTNAPRAARLDHPPPPIPPIPPACPPICHPPELISSGPGPFEGVFVVDTSLSELEGN